MCTKSTLNIVITDVVEKAKEIFGSKLDCVILYGSYARQDYDDESDIDIMILADIKKEDIQKHEKEFSDFALETDLNYNIVLSLIIQDTETYNRWKNSSVFFKNVEREGIKYVA